MFKRGDIYREDMVHLEAMRIRIFIQNRNLRSQNIHVTLFGNTDELIMKALKTKLLV
jgi:hypothetical protein